MQPENSTYHLIRGTVLLLIIVGLLGWALIRALKRSGDPGRLVFQWLLTVGVIALANWIIVPLALGNPFIGVPLAAGCGLALAIIWRHELTDIVAKPFGSLFDGGDVELEPRPYYSIADAKRKKGLYHEAIAEIRKQLDKFPTDFEGQIKLAEIQAENLNDLPGVELTIQRLCAQAGHPPINVVFALNSLADWHLKYGLDPDTAREDLEKVIELFPESEFAQLAAQRIAHLPSREMLLAARDRPRIHLPEGVKRIGLMQSSAHLQPAESDPANLAAQYVEHLQLHPQDAEAREKLAVIYADHYGRLDMATDQLNQLIEQPHQPAKLVVHWLNLLADLQVRHGADLDAVRLTLERIIERYPNHAAAEMARNRLNLLKLEMKARGTSKAVKMGTYEQNIGLKYHRSRPG